MKASVRWVECPRDAWQGFSRFIPTEEKVAFLNELLEAGFAHLDLTSFVSPKWVPQMQDAEEVLKALPRPTGAPTSPSWPTRRAWKGPSPPQPHPRGLPLLPLRDLPAKEH